ncbi:hypothetical protein SAMN05192558_104190 [Actinokineospora alba]|uniref:Uncharacterized protein n=1 Tax=Actinokineospora alba TaxID=504798 RepID=A0A1H0LLH8_9PSEU|nr:hypothetical protein [Actinokineospora alba]TDP67366.1 hypothetical protein C8E96_2908 [Actinokineospora alba]SDI98701.1 hypothetical protein SAMN05421871_109107 [Actinokineospora alba]SDO68903.1 hypothetical protein SAMN05192558_104190 [Actinokineospora alba]
MSRKRKQPGARKAAPKDARPEAGPALSWWRNLGRGPKWLAATMTPLILAVAIPGIAPWAVDRTRDLFGEQKLTASGEDYPSLIAGAYWTTDAIVTEPMSTFTYKAVVDRDGAQMGTSGHKVTLISNRAGQIAIEKVTAVVESRRPPLAGTAFIADPQGSADVAQFDFQLDSFIGGEIPALVRDESGDPTKPMTPYLANGKIRYVEEGKPEHLMIRASTTKCYCQWRVHIEYSYRGSRTQIIVPPPSAKPFATTAWSSHQIEYNMHTDNNGTAARHDCGAQPSICRTKPGPGR